jgi:hypothetical protein
MGSKVMVAGFIVACAGIFLSCGEKKKPAPVIIKHLAQTGWRGSAGIYVDRVPNKAVLKDEGADTAATSFYCLRIGLYDSTATVDAKQKAAKEKYYQLDMYRDWVLLNNGDSIAPVFYQPVPHKEEQLTEHVLVYEMPKGFKPSRLVYKDPYGLLGNRQVLILNENNP